MVPTDSSKHSTYVGPEEKAGDDTPASFFLRRGFPHRLYKC